VHIRPFHTGDEPAVVALWEQCQLTRPWNDPHKDIARKLKIQPELFLVGVENGAIVATVMAGYEGHRGWVNYLAVAPAVRGRGFGRALMDHVEQALFGLGCPKVSLLIRAANPSAVGFYRHIGYAQDEVVTLGKRLIQDGPAA
jgi:ribosomal protein S18 acetylase RimI-like enzyme